jgi:N-acetyl-1-D-myo-inositol-2-amino-2-deoxy-alpha-D-glucopyranoside deacetylase
LKHQRRVAERRWAVVRPVGALALVILLATLLFCLPALSGCTNGINTSHRHGLRKFEVSSLGHRVLVIAPHPDDEALATAGLIKQCVSRGMKVRVVMVTCGDGSMELVEKFTRKKSPVAVDFRRLGVVRSRETLTATKELGLSPGDVIFLCYPDGGINSLWSVNWDYDKLHAGSNGFNHAPYSFAYQKDAPYCGQNLVTNLQSIIKDFGPTAIVYPDQRDIQHDHWAVNAFVQYVVATLGVNPREYTYLVHRHDFPRPVNDRPNYHLYPPAPLLRLNTTWKTLSLSRDQERAKEGAIRAYSIPRLIKEPFFESFIRRNELFGTERIPVAKRFKGSSPDFTAKNMPFVVIHDPVGDTLEKTFRNGGDLREVSLAIGDKKSYLALETGGEIRPEILYAFGLRVFRGQTVYRFDIHVSAGHAFTRTFADNSMNIKQPIPTRTKASRLWIEIPSGIFKSSRECMLGVDAILGHRRVDKTAWQRIKIE